MTRCPYLSQQLPFAVRPARLGVRHHMSQLRFALLRFIPAGFHRDGRLRGNGLQYLRAHPGD